MARPICSCGMVMYQHQGISVCLHCDDAPKGYITNCTACRVFHHTVDARVTAEYQAERAEHNQ